ncbi:MAG: c(7)-type cytochrome triheme domain-containing protein [Thermodesulfobacteriota bacterium]|jgi:c(7)-type cytochrome triheme protein
MKKALFFTGLLVFTISIALAQTGVKKRRPLPFEYGRVVINNYSETSHISPVVFDHWLHRAKFTCRICHVDIGFAMQTEVTDIRAADNINGYYCGTCHNGKDTFSSCKNDFTPKDSATCDRCHSLGKKIVKKYDFREFVKDWPRERLGNGVDWEKTEEQGLITPVDFIEGVSIKREKLADQADFELGAKVEGMPDILFSHRKHTIWNGCELCHPEIFIGIKKGITKYSMVDIYDGKYCGVCHKSVAFPLLDCQRCHTEEVR